MYIERMLVEGTWDRYSTTSPDIADTKGYAARYGEHFNIHDVKIVTRKGALLDNNERPVKHGTFKMLVDVPAYLPGTLSRVAKGQVRAFVAAIACRPPALHFTKVERLGRYYQ